MKDAASANRKALAFIFATVALDMLALGAVAPVLVPLIERFLGGNVPRSAHIVGLLGTAFALMQFAWAPVLGVLSDRFGRRPVLILSGLGLAIDYGIMAVAPNVWWLFAGRVLSGITSANAVAAYAYVADVTPAPKRAAAFGTIGAAFGLGFVVGPAFGGLLGLLGPRVPFWAAAALSLINAAYGALVVPESLAAENRKRFEMRRANPLGALRLLLRHPRLFSLGTVSFVMAFAQFSLQSTWVLYVTYRYGWGSAAIGGSLAALGFFSALTQGVVVNRFVARFGERTSLGAGLVLGALGFVVCALGPNPFVFCLSLPLLSLWGLAGAAIQSLMTHRVAPNEQGQLQGALGSLRGLAALVSPGISTTAFAFGTGHAAPGAAWLLGATLLLVALVPALREAKPVEQEEAVAAATA